MPLTSTLRAGRASTVTDDGYAHGAYTNEGDRDLSFMRLALAEARTARSGGDWPFGAIVVFDRTVVARAYSTERATGDPTAHAELNALRAAGLEHGALPGCALYTTHEPCVMCAGAIIQAKIRRLVIGSARVDRPDLFRPRRIPLEQIVADCRTPPDVVWGVMRAEALRMFEGVSKTGEVRNSDMNGRD